MSPNTATFTSPASRPAYALQPAPADQPMERRLPVTCPDCRTSELVSTHAVVAVCSGCQKSIRCIECATCGHCFVTSKQRRLQCPRCLDRIRTWKGSDVAFEYLAEQRQVGVAPVDLPFVAPGSPEVLAGRGLEEQHIGGLAWVVVVVLGVAGAAGVVGIVAALEATGSRAVPCQLASARSTLTFSASRDARRDYHVTALGRTVNESSRALHDVVVTWVVRYADGSAGRPTATALPNQGTVPRGATSAWSAPSSTNGGRARPTGVRVLHTYTTATHPTCLL